MKRGGATSSNLRDQPTNSEQKVQPQNSRYGAIIVGYN